MYGNWLLVNFLFPLYLIVTFFLISQHSGNEIKKKQMKFNDLNKNVKNYRDQSVECLILYFQMLRNMNL
jgi:hypothetical protein